MANDLVAGLGMSQPGPGDLSRSVNTQFQPGQAVLQPGWANRQEDDDDSDPTVLSCFDTKKEQSTACSQPP